MNENTALVMMNKDINIAELRKAIITCNNAGEEIDLSGLDLSGANLTGAMWHEDDHHA